MTACIKITLLALMLFLPSYSQHSYSPGGGSGGIGDMLGGLPRGPSASYIRNPRIHGDTIKLRHDMSYALFSGTFQGVIKKSYAYRNFKVKSVIKGEIDTTNNKSIARVYNLKICSNIEFEINKDYLILDVIKYDDAVISPYIPELGKCDDILPDTPENREMLIKKYEGKVVIYE